ncbi:CG8878 [Drosophila busckii]|uniref:non-specific serine/threonine protein kinase n=1 Tax=Drosophila busckii TaxID=30019 RepID=A0A0M4EKB2_DROBS|nr:uncharacterized protein LOC108597282 [Drosophila busckii]XP_017839239.1 uncharacterized protein LOC108597282 [Drosophila busckii]ALC41805.1 CG8878 [Drosophila busckii]
MGKRIAAERHQLTPPQTETKTQHTDRSIRKRRRSAVKGGKVEKYQRLSNSLNDWQESEDEDDDDSSSSSRSADAEETTLLETPQPKLHPRASLLSLAAYTSGNYSYDFNNSNATESPRPVYTLCPSVVNGTILRDVLSKAWRLGKPIGKGNFGEIFLASDDTVSAVSVDTAKYVVKIEPHSNGPLFVEVHCLINANNNKGEQLESVEHKQCDELLSNKPPTGIPSYIASGTHYFNDGRYRFLVLPRYDRDLHSIIKNSRVDQKSLLVLAIRILNVLEHLHDKGYCHNDIKAQNLMISKCKYLKRQTVQTRKSYDDNYDEKQQTTDSGNSSEQETNDDDYFIKKEKFSMRRISHTKHEVELDEDEDFDDGATTNSNNSNSLDVYQTPVKNSKRRARQGAIEFSGSNPMRSCRRNEKDNSNATYDEMVKSHYLRPAKHISYSELYNEDGYPVQKDSKREQSPLSSDNDSEEFLPPSSRRSGAAAATRSSRACQMKATRTTRRQQALVAQQQQLKSTPKCAPVSEHRLLPVQEEHIFLIDFGLASKYQDRGVHRPFIMDQRRAHDGTLEFTSRDAHLGAHSRRSDLECLGYNLLYWSEGYLPWQDVAQQQQPEKVHRAKELFMTDVCEMLRQFYGKQVPKYLGEFLQQIGHLSYQERPNYEFYRNIFMREYRRLGYDCSTMRLSSADIHRHRIRKDEVDGSSGKRDIFELAHNKLGCNAVMSLGTPFQEGALTNRVSPKNLRSKSNKKNAKKKKFSWAEVLSQDPDQIARERAVKEFEREEFNCPLQTRPPRRYQGRPTYAILTVEQCRRDKGLTVPDHQHSEEEQQQQQKKRNNSERDKYETESELDSDSEVEEVVEEEEEEVHKQERVEVMCVDQHRGRGRPRKHPVQQPAAAKSLRSRKVKPRSKLNGDSENVMATALTAVVGSNKRGCATRKENNATMASATGEVEHSKLKSSRAALHMQDEGEEKEEQQQKQQQAKQRRTRRCLYKTESKMRGELDVENNSNYASNVQNVYNNISRLWQQYDDENSYGRRTLNDGSRHCRK